MTTQHYPVLEGLSFTTTRDALHAYARIPGDWLKHCRSKRKHWWHASLRPSLNGLTSGIIHAEIDFEIELNLRQSFLEVKTSTGKQLSEKIHGQSAAELADKVKCFLIAAGVDQQSVPEDNDNSKNETAYSGYSEAHALSLAQIMNSVFTAMKDFRAGIREETSPVQLWPHHFDLSMLWLPGELIAGQDPANEEYADKQMNFGFTFGDEGIAEPYFYITAYPLPDALPETELPAGTLWQSEGFSGAVLLYKDLIENCSNPHDYLLDLWRRLLSAGREHMLANSNQGDPV